VLSRTSPRSRPAVDRLTAATSSRSGAATTAGTSARPVHPVAPAMQTEITRSAALDELDPVAVRIPHEADARPTFADRVGRPLGLDPFLGQTAESRVEVVDSHSDVAVAGPELVAALRRLEVVREP